MGVLFRSSAKDRAAFQDKIDEHMPNLTNSIIESIGGADAWKKQKVKKTIQITGLWTKAAKLAEKKKEVGEQGARIMKAIESAIELDKTMANLKSKQKEIKRVVENL